MWVDRTAAERMARQRQRRKEGGLVEVRLWVRPELVPALKAIAAGEVPPSLDPVPDPADRLAKTYREMSKFPNDGSKDRTVSFMVTFFEKPRKEIRGKLSKIGIRRNGKISDGEADVWEGFAKIDEVRDIEEEIFRSKGVIRA